MHRATMRPYVGISVKNIILQLQELMISLEELHLGMDQSFTAKKTSNGEIYNMYAQYCST